MNTSDARSTSFTERLSVVAVSAYLLAVGLWLMASRRLPAIGFRQALRAQFMRPYRGDLTGVWHEEGHCYKAPLPAHLLSDKESTSRLELFENGQPLGPARAHHNDIRRVGQGTYSHWADELLFSTSDNSDPRTNGRRYHVEEHR